MKIRREASLGLKLMIAMARAGGPARSNDLLPGVSPQNRSEALSKLLDAGLIRRESRWHYALARPAGRISLLDIIEACQGPLKLKFNWASSGLGGIYTQAADALRNRLGKVRLATLSREATTTA